MGFGEARARRALAQLARAGASSGDAVQAAMERMLADPGGAHDDSAADEGAGDEEAASSSAAGGRGGGGGAAEGSPVQEVRAVGDMACLCWLHWLRALGHCWLSPAPAKQQHRSLPVITSYRYCRHVSKPFF